MRLPGHIVSALTRATKAARPVSATANNQMLTLTVVLNRTDEAGFQRFLADVEDLHSSNHGKFISQAEITRRFGPSQQAYDATLAFLQQQGFTLVAGSANRLTLTVKGTRAQAEKAFRIQIDDYHLANRSFFANNQDPAVPRSIARHIQAVVGLSNLSQPQSNRQRMTKNLLCSVDPFQPSPIIKAFCNVGYHIDYYIYEFGCLDFDLVVLVFIREPSLYCDPSNPFRASAGNPRAAAVPGTGQKIGLLEFDTFNRSDVSAYLNLLGAPATRITQLSTVAVNGGVATPGPGEGEVLLDIDTVMNIAPGANVAVYSAPSNTSFQSLFNAMINDGDTVISNSWSYCEDQTSFADVRSLDAIFANGAASGVGVFNASGDTGSTCLDGSLNTVGVPADAPHATAVGGTSATVGPGLTYGGETWWDGSTAAPPTGQGGFGISRFFSRPAYQDGLTSAATRSVPDVVAVADPRTGLAICQADAGGCPDGSISGGTSMAAPEWAAMAALLNQSRGHNLGNLNPLLYPRANTTAFHTPASMGSDFAHVGLGSPRLDQLDIALGGLTVGPGDSAHSSVTEVPNIAVAADGTSTTTIQITLVDANFHYVIGKNASLTASAGSHATISAASGPSTVDNGTVLFTVTDNTIEDVTFTGTDTTDGVLIKQTATVHFVAPSATTGGISASPTTVTANGTAASTITVTLLNAKGQGASGKVVTLSQGAGHSNVAGPTPATTDSTGKVTFTVKNTTTESVTYTALDVTDGNLPVPGSAVVSFINGSPPPCSTGTPTAASGYAFTDFATGLGTPGFCESPAGITFDAAGNLYVMNVQTGFLYKFGPRGGIADANAQLNTTAIGGVPIGLAFGKDGKLYLARPGANDVLELNPTNGTIVRTVATGLCFPLGLATDPLSGDLFVTQSCSANMMRIANPASATPTVTVYSTPGQGDGLTVAPDGTFYVAANQAGNVVRVAGTNAPTPGATTILVNVPQLDGIGLAVNAGVPAFLFLNRNNGIITKVDLGTNPVTTSDIFTGGSRGDMAAVGPDGCFYATQSDRIIKVTNADGSCPFSPTITQPQLGLTPSTFVSNPPTGNPVTFTATLYNVSNPGGTPVTFTVSGANVQIKQVQAGANGVATFTYTGAHTGADTVKATATAGVTVLTSYPSAVTWVAGKDVTFISLNLSATSGAPNTTTTLTASLTDVSTNSPTQIGGAVVTISIGSQSCQVTTGNDGVGSCSITPNVAPGSYRLVASYAGNGQYTASTASTAFSVSNLVPPLSTLSKQWYFAEGYSGPFFNVYYTVFNPGSRTATVTVTYYLENGTTQIRTHLVAAQQPLTWFANAEVAQNQGFGAQLSSDQPIMAERASNFLFVPLGVSGASDVVGVTAPNTQWYFAEGYTGPGFSEYLTLINPSATQATSVTLTYFTQSGTQPPKTFSIPAGRRQTIWVNDNINPALNQSIPLGVGPNQSVSLALQSTVPIVAERPMYFIFQNFNAGAGGPSSIPGGHVVMGANSLGTTFNFAEGYTGANFNEWLTFMNPDTRDTTATITYLLDSGLPVTRTLFLPHGTRQTVQVASATDPAGLGQVNRAVSVRLTSGAVPILVERPLYFAFVNQNGNGGFLTGGSVVVGSNTLGVTVVFASGTTQTNYNEYLTIENSNSTTVNVSVTYYVSGRTPLVNIVAVPANSRGTIFVPGPQAGGGIGPNVDALITSNGATYPAGVSVVLASDQPILAERPMYMLATNNISGGPATLAGGNDVVGVTI